MTDPCIHIGRDHDLLADHHTASVRISVGSGLVHGPIFSFGKHAL
jgi:hypothetical protein